MDKGTFIEPPVGSSVAGYTVIYLPLQYSLYKQKINFDTVPVPTADTVQLVAGFKTPAPIVELEQGVDLEYVQSAVVEDRIGNTNISK